MALLETLLKPLLNAQREVGEKIGEARVGSKAKHVAGQKPMPSLKHGKRVNGTPGWSSWMKTVPQKTHPPPASDDDVAIR